MNDEKSLERYCQEGLSAGAVHALIIDPKRVVTAPWVRWKCQYGCNNYGKKHTCPPHSPPPEQTRQNLDSYNRAILFHVQWMNKKELADPDVRNYIDKIRAMERELFLDGYYRAFVMLAGSCRLCEKCTLLENLPCSFRDKARPSMEACGIDVYQTAHNHGLPIHTLRDHGEMRNEYCLLLVD